MTSPQRRSQGRRASLTNGVTLISIIRGSTPRRPTREKRDRPEGVRDGLTVWKDTRGTGCLRRGSTPRASQEQDR